MSETLKVRGGLLVRLWHWAWCSRLGSHAPHGLWTTMYDPPTDRSHRFFWCRCGLIMETATWVGTRSWQEVFDEQT